MAPAAKEPAQETAKAGAAKKPVKKKLLRKR